MDSRGPYKSIDDFRADIEIASTRERLSEGVVQCLWDAANSARVLRGRSVGRDRHTARDHRDKAEAISNAAGRLLKLLASFDHIGEAISSGYLVPERKEREVVAYDNLFDLVVDFADWPTAVRIRPLLPQLKREADEWAKRAKRVAAFSPGRPADKVRLGLSGFVGFHLASEGVHLTKTKDGTFARVLAVVQYAAGFRRDQFADVERDVLFAIGHSKVIAILKRRDQAAT